MYRNAGYQNVRRRKATLLYPICQVCRTLETPKCTAAMIAKSARDEKATQYWHWHIMHLFNNLIHDTRRMYPCLVAPIFPLRPHLCVTYLLHRTYMLRCGVVSPPETRWRGLADIGHPSADGEASPWVYT